MENPELSGMAGLAPSSIRHCWDKYTKMHEKNLACGKIAFYRSPMKGCHASIILFVDICLELWVATKKHVGYILPEEITDQTFVSLIRCPMQRCVTVFINYINS